MPVRILIVDHDAERGISLSRILGREGYQTILAADGLEGLKHWSQDRPDLILLEADVPQLDGYQLAARIRAEEGAAAHVPILMLTDVAQTEHKIRAVRAGADDLQLRPVHDAELAARIRGLLVRFAPRQPVPERSTGGRIHAFYGAKGGVGSTTLAINSAIALHRGIGRRVALMDGNLQFGDHRVFLDLGSDRRSIIDVVSSSAIDQDVLRSLVVRHDTGIDLMLAPPTPESAELVNQDQHHVAQILGHLRDLYDYVVIDVDKRLDDTTLDVIGLADVLFVVMTADLSCLKNVRLVLETMKQLGVSQEKVQLVLNRSNAFTGINVKAAEGALRRRIDYQVVNDYRTAISALNSGAPFNAGRSDSPLARAVLDFVRAVDKQNHAVAASTQLAPARL